MVKLKFAATIKHKASTRYALLSVLIVSAGQLLIKWALSNLSPYINSESNLNLLFEQTSSYLLALSAGIICYGVSMLFWMIALRTLALSRAYPLLSLSYGLVYAGAIFTPGLNEPFSWLKMTGILLIVVGTSLIFKEPEIK